MKKIITLWMLTVLSISVSAQSWNQNMRIGEWNITIEANQFTAKTIMELQFCNDAKTGDAEAFYSFYLKPNQAVTHFELMLGDKFRDGSIEERWKAVNTYNSIVGKRIDPAVLQKHYGNYYNLNVYPVAANGCRKVRITIEEKLRIVDDKLVYSLPLLSPKAVSQFAVNFTTENSVKPIEKGLLKNLVLQNKKIFYTNQFKNINDSIYVEMPILKKAVCFENKENKYYLAYRNALDFETEKPIQPKKVALYFDVSMANSNNDFNIDFDFLKNYLEQNSITNFTAIAFNQEVVFEQYLTITNLNYLKYKLRNWKFTGASNLNIVANADKRYDAILLFSKGTSTYANITKEQTHTPVFAFVKEKDVYQTENLKKTVRVNGGKIITLDKRKIKEAITQTQTIRSFIKQLYLNEKLTSFQLIDTNTKTQPVLFAESNEPIRSIQIVFTNSVTNEAVTIAEKELCSTSNLDKLNILYEYESLERNRNNYYNHYDNYWTKALSFGRKNKIITEQTAYLVLERIEDYINYGITPPKEIEQQVVNDPRYVKRVDRDPVMWDEANRVKQNLTTSINYYNSYLAKHGLAKFKSKEEIALDKVKVEALAINYAGDDQRRGNSFSLGDMNLSNNGTFLESSKSQEVVVVAGYGTSAKRSMTSASAVIHQKDLKQINNNDLATTLAARIPGVQVIRESNGLLNNNVGLKLRGASTITGNSQALVVVDGVAIGNSFDFGIPDVSDIESVTVLKDISATTLYGSRAANGAVIIQTRKGKYNTRPVWKKYNLYDMEDVDYMDALRSADRYEMWNMYETLKKDFGHKVNFYIDAAEQFAGYNRNKEAKDILLSALEIAQTNNDKLFIGYALDDLGWHSEARNVYTNIPTTYYDWSSYQRSVALSYLMENKVQDAANAYYKSLTENSNYYPYDNPTIVLEFNALLSAYKGQIDTSQYEIVFANTTLPLKHVAVESTNGAAYYVSLTNESTNNYYDYNYYGRIRSFNFNETKNKTDELAVKCYNYYGDNLNFARVVEFENFGKENQKLKIQTHNLTDQYGDVVIQKIKN